MLGVNDPKDGALARRPRTDSRLSRRRYRAGRRPAHPRQQWKGLEPRKHAAGGASRHPRPRRQRHAGRSALSRRGHRAARTIRGSGSSPVSTRACRPAGSGRSWARCTSISAFCPALCVARRWACRPWLLWRDDRAFPRRPSSASAALLALRDELADDHRLGDAVRARASPWCCRRYIVEARVSEPSFAALWRHELRWARTVRAIAPAAFAGSILTHPVAIAALGGALLPDLA